MVCEPKDRQAMIGSSYFLGLVIGYMMIPRLADTYGRKVVFVATMFS